MEHCQHSVLGQFVRILCTVESLCPLKHVFLFFVGCPIVRVHSVVWLLWPCPEPIILQEVLCNCQCFLCMLKIGVLLHGYAFPLWHAVRLTICCKDDEIIPRDLAKGEEGPMQKHAVRRTLCKCNPGLQLCPLCIGPRPTRMMEGPMGVLSVNCCYSVCIIFESAN